MSFESHPLMVAHLERHDTDNDVRQAARLLDKLTAPGNTGFFVGDCDEPLAAVAHELGHHTTSIDLRPWNTGYWSVPEIEAPAWKRVQGDIFTSHLPVGHFDYAVATSSIEHFGLSEFGGVQDPYGDVWAMRRIWELLANGGLAIITVPVKKTWRVDPHWRGYTHLDLHERIVGPFKVELEEFWWTSIKGNEQATRGTIETYDESCDLSALLVLRKELA